MDASVTAFYARMADEQARGPQLYGGNASVAALRCFIRYHKSATIDVVDAGGRPRWITHTQMRLHGLITREAVARRRTTMRDMAREAQCAPSTVSRTILKFQAWGIVEADITRGRNGGVVLRLAAVTDRLTHYVREARRKLRDITDKAHERLRRNVASMFAWNTEDEQGEKEIRTYYVQVLDATFNQAWHAAEQAGRLLAGQTQPVPTLAPPGPDRTIHADRFAAAVYAERRRLAIVDPAGEADAVRPLWR